MDRDFGHEAAEILFVVAQVVHVVRVQEVFSGWHARGIHDGVEDLASANRHPE